MARVLRNLRIDDVSSVDVGAGRGVKVVLTKRNMPSLYESMGPDEIADLSDEVAEYLKREFSAKDLKKRIDDGHALPDGSFPIDKKEDVGLAIEVISRAKNMSKAKAHIKARAYALAAADALPEDWSKGLTKADVLLIAERNVFGKVCKAAQDFNDTSDAMETAEDAGELMCAVRDAMCALDCSIQSIMCDDDITDKVPSITTSFNQFKAYLDTLDLEDDADDETEKAWSDAAREAAAEARRQNSPGSEPSEIPGISARGLAHHKNDLANMSDHQLKQVVDGWQSASAHDKGNKYTDGMLRVAREEQQSRTKKNDTTETNMTVTALNTAAVQKMIDEAVTKANADKDQRIAKLETELVLSKMSDAQKTYHDNLGSDAEKKKFQDMSPDQRDGEMDKTKKRLSDDPVVKGLMAENADLRKRLDAMDDERDLKIAKIDASKLGFTQTDAGEVLMKMRRGDKDAIKKYESYVEALAQSKKAFEKSSRAFDELGHTGSPEGSGATAMDQINEMAKELRKKDPSLTEAQAFDKAYNDPASAELRQAEAASRMAKIHGRAA